MANVEQLILLNLFIQPKPFDRILEVSLYSQPTLPALFENSNLDTAAWPQQDIDPRQNTRSHLDIHHISLSEIGTKPLSADYFDYIVLAPEARRGSKPSLPYITKELLNELHRALKETGRLLGYLRNRWSHNHLIEGLRNNSNHSYFSFQKELKQSGFIRTDFFSLGQDGHALTQLTSIFEQTNLLGTPINSALKARIKNGLLAPHFMFTTSAKDGVKRYPFQVTRNAVMHALNDRFGPDRLEISSHTVSRKEKIIYSAYWGEHDLIIKTPFSPTAGASEANNFRCLEHLSKWTGLYTQIPRPVVCETKTHETYFIESCLSGVALGDHTEADGENLDKFSIAFSILEDLYLHSRKDLTNKPTSNIYSRLVQTKIDLLYHYTLNADLKRRLQDYFSLAINWEVLPTGICHGDFSVSNILCLPTGNPGLIDWETADLHGLPILDAINFLDSYIRLTNKGCRVNQSIPTLAKGHFPSQSAKQFMSDAYRLYSIDPAHHQTLVHLRWLHHVSYLIQFWLRFDKKAQDTYIYDIAKTLPSG